MRVGVFGGSFDPPHVGHLMVSSWLRWTDQVDEVWWVPSGVHPFGKPLLPFATRLGWCERAVGDLPWVRVDPIEATLPAPTFTIDTLNALRERHPTAALRLVVGADVLGQTDRWRAWPEIVARFAPITVGRVGYPTPPGAVDFPAVSSTDIRERAAAGQPVDSLVPSVILREVQAAYGAHSPG
jgi:nicotinate-nucleotide adenylyltransferase